MQMDFVTLISGSSGNAAVASTADSAILIDAGAPGQTLSALLTQTGVPPEKLAAIVVTHDHADHTSGVGVMARRYELPVYATSGTWAAMTPKIGRLPDRLRNAFCGGDTLAIADFSVKTFSTPHDAVDPVGLTVDAGGPVAGILTDIGFADEALLNNVAQCDVLLIEANHDEEMLRFGPYPPQLKARIFSDRGHLSNRACGEALVYLAREGLPCAVLGHLSKENNTPELAIDTVAHILRQAGVRPGGDILLDLAPRSVPGRRYRIG